MIATSICDVIKQNESELTNTDSNTLPSKAGPSERIQYWCGELGLIFTIHKSGASGASNGMGSRGPLKGPWRGPGAESWRGSRGQCPGSFMVLSFAKGPERLSWKYFL